MECIADRCNNDARTGDNKCALHCKKNSYQIDFSSGLLLEFQSEFIRHISTDVNGSIELLDLTTDGLVKLLSDRDANTRSTAKELLKNSSPVLTGISFPHSDSRDYFDYSKILTLFPSIQFHRCDYVDRKLEMRPEMQCFFYQCEFYGTWNIQQITELELVSDVIYEACTFHENTLIGYDDYVQRSISPPLFRDCKFKKTLECNGVNFQSPLFNNTDFEHQFVDGLLIDNCVFSSKFILNNCETNEHLFYNSTFKDKFEFKYNTVNELEIVNTNFKKLVDTFETNFHQFLIKKCIFSDFVGFEKCTFGTKENTSNQVAALFEYATFMSFANFRNTKFINGLNIENVNLKETPNFLNAEVNPNGSNRETFRIIKHSLDSRVTHEK